MDKSIRKILSVVLAAAVLTVSVCASVTTPVYAASKLKLSRSSAVLKTNKTIKLTVKNAGKRVRWKTSDKSIAFIKSKKGKYGQTAVIKAGQKPGSCRITATVGKRKLRCRIRVEMNYNVKLSSSTKNLTATVSAGSPGRKKADSRFIGSAADFSFELLRKTVETDSEKGKSVNTLISPDSMLTALVMTENGAAGDTLHEMEAVLSGGISVSDYNRYLSGLNHRLTSAKTIKYSVANSIWTRKGVTVRKSFLKANKTYHNAQVYRAPFNGATVKDMNKWVWGKTRGMIDRIIDMLTPEDKAVLINAIAFEGNWTEPFPDPVPAKFTSGDGTVKDVNTLHQRGSMEFLTVNGGKGFAKNYMGGQIAFAGLLPPEDCSVDEYLEGISGSDFISAWESRKYMRIDATVPEFKYDYDASMAEPLKKMGMKKAFSADADFSAMCDPLSAPGLCIGDVLHKTHIELDKKGTKAAAVTAVIAKASSAPIEKEYTEVHLDRPFVYVLVDTGTGIPLFVGVLRNVR